MTTPMTEHAGRYIGRKLDSGAIVAVQAYRRVASREERELQDVERAMEEELVAEHMQVERVIHLRLEQVQDKQQLKYLVKVCNTLLNLCSV